MADNIEFRSDMADEGHIGEAIGLYEANKRIVHLSAPNVGNRSVPAAPLAGVFFSSWTEVEREVGGTEDLQTARKQTTPTQFHQAAS